MKTTGAATAAKKDADFNAFLEERLELPFQVGVLMIPQEECQDILAI